MQAHCWAAPARAAQVFLPNQHPLNRGPLAGRGPGARRSKRVLAGLRRRGKFGGRGGSAEQLVARVPCNRLAGPSEPHIAASSTGESESLPACRPPPGSGPAQPCAVHSQQCASAEGKSAGLVRLHCREQQGGWAAALRLLLQAHSSRPRAGAHVFQLPAHTWRSSSSWETIAPGKQPHVTCRRGGRQTDERWAAVGGGTPGPLAGRRTSWRTTLLVAGVQRAGQGPHNPLPEQSHGAAGGSAARLAHMAQHCRSLEERGTSGERTQGRGNVGAARALACKPIGHLMHHHRTATE